MPQSGGDSPAFSWEAARTRLAGLPGGGLNIAHEACDRHLAAGRGDRPAIRFIGRRGERRTLTYADLAEASNRAAAVLRDLGIGPGDVVAVALPRIPELYAAALGVWKVGAIFSPLLGSLGPGPLRARLELGLAKALIATDSVYAAKIAAQRQNLPSLGHVLLIGEDGGPAHAGAGAGDFRAMTAAADPARGGCAATREEDPAFLHFTSGTTGIPKGALHPHRAVLSHLVTAGQVFALTEDDVYWCTAEPGWVTGTAYGIVAPLANGCLSLVDEAGCDPRRWLGILHDEEVTVWYTTPTAIRMMRRLGTALARSYSGTSLRVAASVGEPLDPESVAWGKSALGVPFHDTWWQTETGAIAIANMPGSAVPGSMGRPLPGVTARLVTCGRGRPEEITEPGAVGELAIRADMPSMFAGYLGDAARYRAAFSDGWLLTGDLVRRDVSGDFWFVGRADDMISSSAQLIGPFEVESLLAAHPAVAEIGVVGKPDLLVREVPVAFVSLNPGFVPGEALRQELLAFARDELGPAMAPREIHFVAALPKTSTGKILRRALKAKAIGEPAEEGVALALDACVGRFDDE